MNDSLKFRQKIVLDYLKSKIQISLYYHIQKVGAFDWSGDDVDLEQHMHVLSNCLLSHFAYVVCNRLESIHEFQLLINTNETREIQDYISRVGIVKIIESEEYENIPDKDISSIITHYKKHFPNVATIKAPKELTKIERAKKALFD